MGRSKKELEFGKWVLITDFPNLLCEHSQVAQPLCACLEFTTYNPYYFIPSVWDSRCIFLCVKPEHFPPQTLISNGLLNYIEVEEHETLLEEKTLLYYSNSLGQNSWLDVSPANCIWGMVNRVSIWEVNLGPSTYELWKFRKAVNICAIQVPYAQYE